MNFTKYLRKSYTLFAITIISMIILITLTVSYFISLQENDAMLINKSGRQRMLSQNIAKQAFYKLLENKDGVQTYKDQQLVINTAEWQEAQEFLVQANKTNDDLQKVDSILQITGAQIVEMSNSIDLILSQKEDSEIRNQVATISNLEPLFLNNMEQVTYWLQQESERKNKMATTICIVLTGISLLVILAEFFLIIIPAQKQLRDKNYNLVTVNKQLSDFAQITAHNLRAPIGNLIFLSNFYKEADSDSEKSELFEKFDTVIQHLDETIHVLLDGLNIKSKEEITTQNLEFDRVLGHTKDLLVGESIRTNATITSDFSEAPTINYNKIYLDSIMLNLVGSALKYSDPSRPAVIKVSSKAKKNNIQLLVEDNGMGIDLKRQGKKVFGLHQTFHRTKNSKGIGLFMTKNQIQSLGGTIEVESIPNKGSTFIVTFKK